MNNELIPPGELIRDELKERQWTQEDLAEILGRPFAAVNEIINGNRSITTQTAQELSAAFGTSPDYWLNLESAYQLAKAKAAPVDEIERRARIFDVAPIKEMQRRGWIKRSENYKDLEGDLCRFFNVPSIDAEIPLRVAARQSVNQESLTASQVVWCCRAKQLAPAVHAENYSDRKLREALPELRALASQPDHARQVPKVLSEAGVRLVLVEKLQGTKIDGAALWMDDAPVIALSLRIGRMDNFWHTLEHEISHILSEDAKRDRMALDLDLGKAEIPNWSANIGKEEAANANAAAALIDPRELESFIKRVGPLYSKQRIIQFANRLKIHPAIIVGQLQYREEIPWNANREMLVEIRPFVVGNTITDGFGHRPEGI